MTTVGALCTSYDDIADDYDALFQTDADLSEEAELIERIRYEGGSVLDIGCGTGLFLDYHGINPGYVGVDPSQKMIDVAVSKHGHASNFYSVPFESFWAPRRFDLVVCLYGSANYIPAASLKRIPTLVAPGGRYVVMLYQHGYFPKTHKMTGLEVPFYYHPYDLLPGKRSNFRENYMLIEGPF